MFVFSLDTEEKTPIITYIDDVKNLENNRTNFGYRELRLINVHDVKKLKSEIQKAIEIYDHNGFIQLFDENKSIVFTTFISSVRIIKSKKNITLSGYVWHQPKGFTKAYKMMINNEIIEKDIWKNFRKDELQGWLVAALNNRNKSVNKENIIIQLDGNDFHNLDEFYCTLGEEVHGAGGYFGRQLYALYDCMRGDFGVKSVSELIWKNHKRSKKLFKTKFEDIIKIFEDHNIKITLE